MVKDVGVEPAIVGLFTVKSNVALAAVFDAGVYPISFALEITFFLFVLYLKTFQTQPCLR